MIIVVSLLDAHPSLHELEFVKPVCRVLEKGGFEHSSRHYSSINQRVDADGIILCGPALGDNHVLEDVSGFLWLREFPNPILGIGGGANLLSKVFGGDVKECLEIGMVEIGVSSEGQEDAILKGIDGVEVYALHTLAPCVSDGFRVLASSQKCVHSFVWGEHVYGMLFHPEVRHERLLADFCSTAVG